MPTARLAKLGGVLRPGSSSTRRMIGEFAEDSGLVYFGYVSLRSDDHHILRGMTVSTNHHDDHYCIGTYDGYDVVFVERSDTLRSGKKHRWHIMEFDLKHSNDIPHTIIGSGSHGNGFHELMNLKFPTLAATELGSIATYPDSFNRRFKTYVSPAHRLSAEQAVTPEIAAMIAAHFTGLVIEITDQALYVYSESSHLTRELLDIMLRNGAWLAEQLDTKTGSSDAAGEHERTVD